MSPTPRSRHPSRWPIPSTILPALLVVLLASAGLGLAIASPARAATAGSTHVTVLATDALAYAPTSVSSPTRSVEIEIENTGTTDHTFTLSSRVNQTAPTGTNSSTNASGTWFDAAHVLADVAVPHGATVFVNVTVPADGSYQFICRYHFPAMAGELVVGASASSGSSGIPLYVYGGIVVVIVIAVVAVALVLRSRGRRPAPPSPPPAA